MTFSKMEAAMEDAFVEWVIDYYIFSTINKTTNKIF